MPTFQRLLQKHPDAEMKWFARGRLWSSPEEARNARERERSPSGRDDVRWGDRGRPRERRSGGDGSKPGRGRDWRPGGDHRDPKQKYADAKQARNAANRKQRFERKHGRGPDRPRGEARAPSPNEPRGSTKPDWRGRAPRGETTRDASFGNRPGPKRDRRNRPHGKPGGWSARQERRGPPYDQRGGKPTENRPPRPKGHGGGWASKERPRSPHEPRHNRGGQGNHSGKTAFGRRDSGPGPWSTGGRKPGRPRGSFPRQHHEAEEPRPPKRPSPTHEPRPSENPPPTPPPRPSEPAIAPPGPPERGRGKRPRRP
jgi:hypothetical protein